MSGRRTIPLLALLWACGPELPPLGRTQQEIVGGSQDAGSIIDDVFLVAMTFDNGANTVCSGTLIGPRSIVTAAHCVDPARQAGATRVTLKVMHKPTDVGLLTSDLISVAEYRLHPNWNAASTNATYDIAMLLLSFAPGMAPRPINRAPLTNFLGQPLRLVGYGRTDPSQPNSSGTRRVANATLTAMDANSFDFGTAGALGICSGDSGGPALHTFPDSVERIIGVHSLTTSMACGSGTDTRIDFHLGFIDQWLADKETSVPDAGPPDAGPLLVDAGSKPDAGAVADAGSVPLDAGTDASAVGGCGCAAAPASWVWLALLALLRTVRPLRPAAALRRAPR